MAAAAVALLEEEQKERKVCSRIRCSLWQLPTGQRYSAFKERENTDASRVHLHFFPEEVSLLRSDVYISVDKSSVRTPVY
jgi:formylmethanofuran:tetrahydromethanopterin formyltransferase